MNILFFTYRKISPTKGGTEHTTLVVAKQLHDRYGCKCWALHDIDDNDPSCDCFEEQIYAHKDINGSLEKIIRGKHIDVVMSEGAVSVTKYVDKIRKKHDIKIKNIFVFHFTPGWERESGPWSESYIYAKTSKGSKKIKAIAKCILYPYFRIKKLSRLSSSYIETYNAADDIVLLTQNYIKRFQNVGHISDNKKFCVIPNALSLPDILNKDDYDKVKKHIVLIVARIDEVQKRISLALKIWQYIKKSDIAKDWQLLIAGEGPYLGSYEKYVEENSIADVRFLGRVNPVPYYTEASIFMMTSRSEGFPLTLNEAMQYGVVPLVFDSFDSIRDIINEGENGYIIPEMDMQQYSDKLLRLMKDASLRKLMAMNGLDSCRRYLPEHIGDSWWNLIKD